MRERARVIDVGSRELELLRQVRSERDDPIEESLHVPRQRVDLRPVLAGVGNRLEPSDEVWAAGQALLEPDALDALNQDPQRPVGDLDHLVDDRDRADLVDVVESRGVDRRIARGHEREHPLAADDVVDQLHRTFLPDRERDRRLREDDRILEWKNREGRREVELLAGAARDVECELRHARWTVIETRPRGAGAPETGNEMRRMPRS